METNSDINYDNKFKPQINDTLRSSIENILKEYETKYNINIFFACDTGSRCLGTAVESSDFDLNGFFVPDYKEYVKIIKKSDNIITKQGMKFKSSLNGTEHTFEIDISLWDIKHWLKEKIDKNHLGLDFYFDSPIIYRNYHPEIISQIRIKLLPPFYYFWGKFKNNLDNCLKQLDKEGAQNKRIMNTLIYCTQYLHCRVFNDFPDFNIFVEIERFNENKEKLINDNLLTSDEYENLERCFNYIQECYEEKKKGKKSLTKIIPYCVKTLNKMLDDRYNGKIGKMKVENPWNADNAQFIFDQILNIYKK